VAGVRFDILVLCNQLGLETVPESVDPVADRSSSQL